MAKALLESGMTIEGFRLEEQLHRGGMAAIWRVTKPGIDVPIVMKVPFLDPAKGELSLLVGFEVEQMIMAELSGRHVPRLVANGAFTEQPFIVMEHVDGVTLKALVDKNPLGMADAVPRAIAIADALSDLHQQKVLHLDLKPANILFRPSGEAVIIDFGLSRHIELPDLLGEQYRRPTGTTDTMSPEQLRWVRADRRSDIYALGAILFKMTTGQLPFGSPSRVAEVRQRVWQDPVPPRQIRPEIEPALQEIILKCLEPNPRRRYATAEELAFDLRNLDLVELTERAHRQKRSSYVMQLRRRLRAEKLLDEIARAAKRPPPRAPIILVVVDLRPELEALRQTLLETAVSAMANMPGARLACLNVMQTSLLQTDKNVDKAGDNIHVNRIAELRAWAAPLELPRSKITYHLIEARSIATGVLEFAHANNVDQLVVGAPTSGGTAASKLAMQITAKAPCSVTVVRAV